MIVEPTFLAISSAAAAIRSGLLAGMPTETVYGIAGDAMNALAVQNIFNLKGRPADNPLIVHLAHIDQIESVAKNIPKEAYRLAKTLWPGPLTMVLEKRPEVPLITTGGLETVAIRIPRHPVAIALIELAERPLAAPSANKFMGLSPTRAENIDPKIAAGLAVILDGGPCEVGVESTVIDMTIWPPRILRLGGLHRPLIESVVGAILEDSGKADAARRSPGQYPRHYAPLTQIRLASAVSSEEAGLSFSSSAGPHQIVMSRLPQEYAHQMYAAFHALDQQGHKEIVVESPPRTQEWEVVWDRLRRASG